MVFFRLIALVLILAAIGALGADLIEWLEAGTLQVRSGGELWQLMHDGSYAAFIDWSRDNLPATAYDPVLLFVLAFPAWATLGALGFLIALIGHTGD
jgi:hypothetical protein